MGLLKQVLGNLVVLCVRFESTAQFSVLLYVLKVNRKGCHILRQIVQPDAKIYKAECTGHWVLIAVSGHGIITKSTTETSIVEKVTSNPDQFAWSVSSDEKKNKTISFVRREQLVSLYKYLSDNHIVWGRIQFAPSVENDASIVCNVTKTFYQQELKWRVLLQPTVQSSLVVKVLCRRLRLPVLIGLLLLLVGNTFIYDSLKERRANQRSVLSAQEKKQGETQHRSQQRIAVINEFSHRLSVRQALLIDRAVSHLPLSITLTELAVQPLLKSLEEGKSPICAAEQLVIKGKTDDAGSVSTLIQGLKSEPLLHAAQLNKLSQNRDNALIEFEITVTL